MTLRTKIEEAIGERHVHKIDNSELLDQISTIFKEELEKICDRLQEMTEENITKTEIQQIRMSLQSDTIDLINSLEEGK